MRQPGSGGRVAATLVTHGGGEDSFTDWKTEAIDQRRSSARRRRPPLERVRYTCLRTLGHAVTVFHGRTEFVEARQAGMTRGSPTDNRRSRGRMIYDVVDDLLHRRPG